MIGKALIDRRRSLRARVCAGGAVTLLSVMVVWLVAAPNRPTASATNDGAQTVVTRKSTIVCMGSDGSLSAPSGLDCGPGQTPVPLDSANADACQDNPWKPTDTPDPSTANGKLSDLERSIKAIENNSLFEVVDQAGQPILQVLPCELAISNTKRERVVTLTAASAGGFLTARNSNDEEISIGAADEVGGVLVRQGNRRRIEFGKQTETTVSLRLPMSDGYEAAIGQSKAGTGALVIGDDFGRARAMLSVVAGKGSVRTQNQKGSPVLDMLEAESAAGMLVIGDAASEPMVKFSVTGNRYGAVLAGPVAGFPMVPGSGLPGSYILGCAGGASCGPGGGGKER